MVTDNYNIEFGYELIGIIPFAYWLHKQGELTGTTSNFDSTPFYYFSPNHEERIKKRKSDSWKVVKAEYDNGYVHKLHLDTSRWVPPPYKEHYKNSDFQFTKPLLVITNKFNVEWRTRPLNYIDLTTLQWLFKKYRKKYKIVYNRFTKDMGYDDKVETLDLEEWDMVRDMGITTMQDLQKDETSYNTLQLKLYSHCNKFITVQGGTSILASYFGGDNIIYARKGMEVRRKNYTRWYHLFGGSKIHHVLNYDDLKHVAEQIL